VEEVAQQETLQEIQVDLVEAVVSIRVQVIQDHQEFVDKVMQVDQLIL
jgi:hypothetical protein